MIEVIPELDRNRGIKNELPIIERYQAILDCVYGTIYELNHIHRSMPIGINFGVYEGVHGSLIDDFMTTIFDHVGDNLPQTIVMTFKGGPDQDKATSDFEFCNDPERLVKYNYIVSCLLEGQGYDFNFTIDMEMLPNPYALLAEGTIKISHPTMDCVSYEIENPTYMEVFKVVDDMVGRINEKAGVVVLKDIMLVDDIDEVPEYSVILELSSNLH